MEGILPTKSVHPTTSRTNNMYEDFPPVVDNNDRYFEIQNRNNYPKKS